MKKTTTILITLVLIAVRTFAATEFNMTFRTVAPGGEYKQRNCVVVWVTTSNGTFVKTLLRYAYERRSDLTTWRAAGGSAENGRTVGVDGYMGATRGTHSSPLYMTATWDLKNKAGAVVPDGTYKINFEMADGARVTHSFNFEKDSTAGIRTDPGTSKFANISINYAPPVPVNTAPVSQSQNPSAVDGNPLAITLVATDAETNAITYNLLSLPATGHLIGTPPELTYLPVRGLTGSDSFTFNATDGLLTGNTATVTVTLVFNDSSSNGIPDSWQSAYGVTNAAADADSDGASNYEEYMAGTDPTNSASVFAINAPPTPNGSNWVIQWNSASNRYYAVQVSTNLVGGWSTLVSNTPATPPVNTYTGTVTQTGKEYYRIRLDP